VTIQVVRIEDVKFDKVKADEVNREEVLDLADNIDENGMVNPIVIDSENKLLVGLRRLLACISLEHETIKAYVRTPEEAKAFELFASLSQPRVHEQVTFDDLCLLARYLQLRNRLSVQEIAERMNRSERTIYRYLRRANELCKS